MSKVVHEITIVPYPFFDPYPYNPNPTTYTAYCSCGEYVSSMTNAKETAESYGAAHVNGKKRTSFSPNIQPKVGSEEE